MISKCRKPWLVVLLPVLLSGGVLLADDSSWHEGHSAYEQARQAVSRGDALPLPEVLRHLHEIAPGKVVATDYEFEFHRWVYEFRIVDDHGHLRKVHLDAHTGELVQMGDD